jgi:nucleoid DNA-binding protein
MGKLTIQDIAKVLVEKSGLTQKEANKFATEMFSIIQQRLEEDELVKIKGFGTFKIINVEARESVSVRTGERVMIDSHAKVTFTPDTVMKELVNKPFSQFETVVLNDGVEFDDVAEDNEEDVAPVEDVISPVEELPVVEMAQVEEEPQVVETPQIEEEPQVEEEPQIEEEPQVEETPMVKLAEDEPVEEEPVADEEPVEEESSWKKWLLAVAVVLVLMGLSAYGGYYYAMQKMSAQKTETATIKKDEVATPEKPVDSVAVAKDTVVAAPVEVAQTEVKAEESVKKEETVKQEVKEPAEEPDPYAAKDERVRLGAYRIVGTAEEVKVLPGQTFYSICRAHLGPDMQCYVEVYNNLPKDPKIKEGQVIKIPKLKLKKKRKG